MPTAQKGNKYNRHSSKECTKKDFEATVNRGGGAKGMQDRAGGPAGHGGKYQCPHCFTPAANLTCAKQHMEAKHPDIEFDEAVYVDKHAEQGGKTVVGVAVRGSVKDKAKY